jgi:tetratricopeptide (TPR) repeat protein
MDALEDTQPIITRSEPPEFIRPDDEDDEPTGPGCMTWGLVGLMVLGVALVIVVMAALAGWTSGQRTAQSNATSTQGAAINEQMMRIPNDLSSGSLELANARLQFLATLTPGVPGLSDLMQTGTAVFLTHQPTPTPMPTATTMPTATSEATQEETTAVTASATGDYDLPALLQEAQTAVSLRDWPTAIERLDVILAVDGSFETGTVRTLMSDALNQYALKLFRSGQLAEAIVWTDRAEQFGTLAEGLNFERLVAGYYLDAVASIGINYPATIQALQEVYSLSPNYRGGEIAQLLFDQYVGYGDALSQQGNFCAAAPQYDAALSIQSSGDIAGRRDTASTLCATITLTPPALLTPGTPSNISPVGVQGN